PFIEQDNLFKSAVYAANPAASGVRYRSNANTPNGAAFNQRVPIYNCPSDPSTDTDGNSVGKSGNPNKACSYACNAQVFGTVNTAGGLTSWYGAPRIPATFQDGTSNTVIFAEKFGRCGSTGNLWGYDGTTTVNNPTANLNNGQAGGIWLPAFSVSYNANAIGPNSKWQ